MRRKDRQMSEEETIDFLKQCKVCRIAMQAQDEVYLVPLNFGYTYEGEKLALFFHSAKEGKKIKMLRENPRVCFEMDGEHHLIAADVPCKYGFSFSSVIGKGRVQFIDEVREKCAALQAIMKQQTGDSFTFTEKEAASVCVFKISVDSLSGKHR